MTSSQKALGWTGIHEETALRMAVLPRLVYKISGISLKIPTSPLRPPELVKLLKVTHS